MSLIVITHPFEGADICATCLQMQLTWFRNEIKEQWNRYNNDGKVDHRVEIPLKLNPTLLCEQGATIVNGSYVCPTHMFNSINAAIEQAQAMEEAAKKPRIVAADGFLKPPDLRN
jgi:hypothetical protein